jgi:hypothetical protein
MFAIYVLLNRIKINHSRSIRCMSIINTSDWITKCFFGIISPSLDAVIFNQPSFFDSHLHFHIFYIFLTCGLTRPSPSADPCLKPTPYFPSRETEHATTRHNWHKSTGPAQAHTLDTRFTTLLSKPQVSASVRPKLLHCTLHTPCRPLVSCAVSCCAVQSCVMLPSTHTQSPKQKLPEFSPSL